MGILDSLFNPQDAAGAGRLAAAFSLLGQRGIGNAGMAGLQASQGFADRQNALKVQTLAEQMQRMQMEAMQRQQQDEQDLRGAIRGSVVQPQLPQTMDNRDVGQPGEQQLTPRFDMNQYAARLAQIGSPQALQAYQSMQREAPKPIISKPGDIARDPTTGAQLWANPQEPEKIDPNKPFMVKDGKIVANPDYQRYAKEVAGAGASRINVPINMGQKGLDNEFKLRGEFKSEPIYKAHQEMQSAYGQIKQSIAQASPAGDLAAATKIMKLLDPGSVVRESELGMAMQATGLLDRVTNYAGMMMSGQKLTPTQRKDFASLADRLMGESVKAYNSKRSEYQKLGSDYGLNADRSLGAAAPDVAPSVGLPSQDAIAAEIERRKRMGGR